MIKNDFSRGVELYSAPELEVISTIVEGGFSFSSDTDGSGIPGVGEDDYEING